MQVLFLIASLNVKLVFADELFIASYVMLS